MRTFRFAGALAALISLLSPMLVEAAPTQCAFPSRDGEATIGSGIVNTYYPGTGSPAGGATSIVIGAADGRGASTPISVGDMLLVIQVQGASVTSTNAVGYGGSGGSRGYSALGTAGNYEYVRASSSVGIGGGTLQIAGGLESPYRTGNATTSNTARSRYQVVRVPQYRNATVTGVVNSPSWNGATGGIVALDVANVLRFSGGTINVDADGFRGGGGANSTTGAAYGTAGTPDYATSQSTNAAHGSKGEGIGGTPLRVFDGTTVTTLTLADIAGALSGARGAPGNAGGGGTDGDPTYNDQNSGGGGGSNGGQGGRGGFAWCTNFGTANACAQSGGIGGQAMPNPGKTDVFLGGGGGAGSMNDNTGQASGAPGGGAIMIRAGDLAGSATLNANGGSFTSSSTNDGTGGGGGGGTVQLFAQSMSGTFTVNARGGNGISNTGAGQSHGPGGGGGGGVVVSNVNVATNVSGGLPGTTASAAAYGANYGATAGSAGVANTAYASTGVAGKQYSGAECTPTVTKDFSPSTIPSGGSSRLTVTLTNPNPTLALSSANITDSLPAGTAIGPNPASAQTCAAGTVIANAGGQSASLNSATISAATSCTYSVSVTSATNGTYVNTIPAGGLSGSIGTGIGQSAVPASATLTVTQGLSISKLARTVNDPVNGYTNPKAIPGAYVQYSLTVTNPSSLSVTPDSVVISDAIPDNTSLVVGSVYAQTGAPNARGPFQFQDGIRGDGSVGTASGLTFTFTSLSDANDSSSFSSDGTTYAYSPTASSTSADASVKAIRLKLFGTMAPSSVMTVNFVVRVN
jgi:uncharacterized repeat protein (TIGR01451 family)